MRLTKRTSTESIGIRPGGGCQRHLARRDRGTASIEMVLCASVMVVVYFLVWGAMRVHRAQQEVVEKSHYRTFYAAQPGMLGRFGSFLEGGGKTTSHTAIMRPTLGSFREPGGFPKFSRLPNEAYTGSHLLRVEFSLGRPNRFVRDRARYRMTLPTGPPWSYYGSERGRVLPYYEKMMEYGIGDVYKSLKLADDSISQKY